MPDFGPPNPDDRIATPPKQGRLRSGLARGASASRDVQVATGVAFLMVAIVVGVLVAWFAMFGLWPTAILVAAIAGVMLIGVYLEVGGT